MNLLTLKQLKKKDIMQLIALAENVKKYPKRYSEALKGKSVLIIFEKQSLRTRVSFDIGIAQLGGHPVYMNSRDTPLGVKESIEDTAKVAGRYADMVVLRLFKQEDLEVFAKYAGIPVINALTDFEHPTQILADLFTIKEKKGTLKKLKLAFIGDGNNNIVHSLLYGCSIVGMDIAVASPKEFEPNKKVAAEAKAIAGKNDCTVEITNEPEKAAKDADIVYADSWMSYHVKESEKEARIKIFKPYQIDALLMKKAKKDALFMNCLPALRGFEQTADVIDGKQSIVFDQAENKLHMQKAIMITLINEK